MTDHATNGPHRPPGRARVEWTPALIEAERVRMTRQRIAIDASTRGPVLLYFGSSVFWLLVGTVFAMIASIKMHSPQFMSSASWLTFGRVRPAHLNAVAYGWAAMAGIGTMLWLMARLCRSEMRYPKMLILSGIIWNFAVAAGLIAILAGENQSIEYLEFPPYIPPILTVAYAIVGLWAILMFRDRREHHIYVSQWYLFAAIFWFPWIYTVVNLMLVIFPITGVTQASINWWYGHNILGLWFTPIGLATAYYLIPKVIGRPIHSYYLSILGFWSLALFYNWNGAHHLIGGPVPTWLVTVSCVASVMMMIPVSTVAINHHMTMRGYFHVLKSSPTLRFTVFGAMSYTAVSVQGAAESLRSINLPTHFTHFVIGHAHLGLYAFYTMMMFAAMYYIMPRLTGWEWASSRLIRVHFWTCAVGILLYFASLTYGGFVQGLKMLDPKVPFIETVRYTVPYLWARSASGILITIGHVAFTILFVMNVLHLGDRRTEPVLFNAEEPIEEPEAALAENVWSFRMNYGPTIFLGVLLTFVSAWLGLIFAPYVQLGQLKASKDETTGESNPKPFTGLAAKGREVYRANGCVYCHSQQIRPEGFGSDIERGWGPRRSVPRDYIYDRPHLLGSMRTGPDLFNIGARQPDANWHHLHLYDPQFMSPGSTMAPFAFLYETRKIVGQASTRALKLPKGLTVEPGYEIVPTEEAEALVAYLKALDHTYPLPETESP